MVKIALEAKKIFPQSNAKIPRTPPPKGLIKSPKPRKFNAILIFSSIDTLISSLPGNASLRPATNSFLAIKIIKQLIISKSFGKRAISPMPTINVKNLSANKSKNAPNCEDSPDFRAKYPSIMSLNPASRKQTSADQSSLFKMKNNNGAIKIILAAVKKLAIFISSRFHFRGNNCAGASTNFNYFIQYSMVI